MSSKVKRCFRCNGQKKMFKTGSAYSRTDTGGVEVDCPLCQGEGFVEIPEVISQDFIDTDDNKDLKNDQEQREESREEAIDQAKEKPKKGRGKKRARTAK